MTVMAAGCISQKYSHQTVLPMVDRFVRLLTIKQHSDGSFSQNIISTALAIQAFQVEGLSSIPEIETTRQKSEEWLASVQLEDGSFDSDFQATVEAVLALSPKGGRENILMSRCNSEDKPSTEISQPADVIQVQLLVWSDQLKQSIEQSIPSGWTIYEALLKAQKDKEIQFKTKKLYLGHYVTTINNITELDQLPLHRWMIYLLPSKVSTSLDLTPNQEYMLKTSITSHHLKQGGRVLFWYRPARN
jgi:hypothetical protein